MIEPTGGTGTAPARSTDKLVALQVLRGLAALSVATIHAEHEGKLRRLGEATAAAARAFPFEAGVDVFFVISGFVMVYASRPLFGRPGGAREFLARRVARIVPLYWLATTLFLLVVAVRPGLINSGTPGAADIVRSYLFIPFTRPDGAVQPVYSLGWTLNYEMFFYVLFALAIGLPRRRAVATVAASLAGLIGFGLLAGPLPQPAGFWTDPILIEFAFGAALGLARAEGATLPPVARLALALAGLAWLAWLGGEAVSRTGLPRAALFAAPAACLVAACGLAPPTRPERETWPARAGGAIGDASYAIYLLHPFVIRASARLIDATGLAPLLEGWAFAAPALAVTTAVSLGVYRWIERPLTAGLRRLLEAPPRRESPAAPRY